jgi:hypothetical protein
MIAFCFLIYDEINHESLWHSFFSKVDASQYRIYIHYKINKPLHYFESFKLKHCVETKWGDISLVKAQNLLLETSLQEDNTHFIFLSGACIPIKSFEFIQSQLKDHSYFNQCPQSQCFPRCDSLLQYMDRSCIQKSQQWCILNRTHATLMLTIVMDTFSIFAPDEHCYIITIYINKLEHEIINKPITFTNWDEGSPKMYHSITKEEANKLLNGPCFFARKFHKDCDLSFFT